MKRYLSHCPVCKLAFGERALHGFSWCADGAFTLTRRAKKSGLTAPFLAGVRVR